MGNAVVYLDHQASTPCEPGVLEAMAPWWNSQAANPSSRLHRPGLLAAAAVEQARGRIATGLAVKPEQVVFTSGATEANNLALKGLAEAELEAGGRRRHLITVATEHRAVLDPLRHLERHGFPLTVLPVGPDGLLEPAALAAALRPDTLLVSVMAANNEIGVLQPLAAIGALCRERGIRFHCDAAQAVGHIPLQPAALGIDLLSFSGHKLGGPMGIGALVVGHGVKLVPQLHGGGPSQPRPYSASARPHPSAAESSRNNELYQVYVGSLKQRVAQESISLQILFFELFNLILVGRHPLKPTQGSAQRQ
jgi:cysteine desulfurase